MLPIGQPHFLSSLPPVLPCLVFKNIVARSPILQPHHLLAPPLSSSSSQPTLSSSLQLFCSYSALRSRKPHSRSPQSGKHPEHLGNILGPLTMVIFGARGPPPSPSEKNRSVLLLGSLTNNSRLSRFFCGVGWAGGIAPGQPDGVRFST